MAEDMLSALRAVIADAAEIENRHDLGQDYNSSDRGLASDPRDLFKSSGSLAQIILLGDKAMAVTIGAGWNG